MADHELDWPVVLRRQPASPGTGHQEDHTGMFEVICGKCGDDPGPDYPEVSSGLRRIRGPYPLAAGIAVFASTTSTTTQPGRRIRGPDGEGQATGQARGRAADSELEQPGRLAPGFVTDTVRFALRIA